MKEIKDRQAYESQIREDKPTVVLFTAGWCPDCVAIQPFLSAVEEEFPQFTFVKINRDDHLDLCEQLQILGIPSFVTYKNGKEISRFVSKLGKSRKEIEAYLQDTLGKGE